MGIETKAEVAVSLRPAEFKDAEGISQVQQRNGMGSPDPRLWRLQWESYPFSQEFSDIPVGWVLEAETGEIVGTIGNVHMLYELEGRPLKASIATAWAVDAPYRGKAVRLVTTFFRQKGVDIWINGSASDSASKVFAGLKIPPIPIPDYSSPCFWAVRPHAFAKAALLRRSVSGAPFLAYPAGLALFARDVVVRSGRGALASKILRLSEFDGRFDALWQAIRKGPRRLRGVRTRAVLDWRFGADIRAGRGAVIVSQKHNELLGYAVLLRRKQDLGMDLIDVADLQAINDDPSTIQDLLLGAIQLAKAEGAAAVKFSTGTPAKRCVAEALRPYTYRLAHWPLYYKAATAELGAALSSADSWDFSLFDTY